MAVCEHFFDDRAELALTLSARIARRLQVAVDNRGAACLFVSGGTTPAPLFESLSRQSLDWPQVTVGLVDERWVDESHEASNAALVRRHLLINHAANAPFWPLYRGGEVADALPELRRDLPCADSGPTVAILGMGSDLHTASIFPGGDATAAALADDGPPVVDMYPTGTPANPPFHRVTLTRSVLARAGMLVLLLSGHDKLTRYRDALTVTAEDAVRAPIAAFACDPRVRLEVYWSP